MSDLLDLDRGRLRAFRAYVPPGAAAVLQLERGLCHWPLGELDCDGFRFCLAPRERGSYCRDHRRLAFRGRS